MTCPECSQLLPSAELAEVLRCLWTDICPELHLDPACRLASNCHICTMAGTLETSELCLESYDAFWVTMKALQPTNFATKI